MRLPPAYPKGVSERRSQIWSVSPKPVLFFRLALTPIYPDITDFLILYAEP